MQPESVSWAMLAQQGNIPDDLPRYPEILTCHDCLHRPDRLPMEQRKNPLVWYISVDDPLPDGWHTVTSAGPGYRSSVTLCPRCHTKREEAR